MRAKILLDKVQKSRSELISDLARLRDEGAVLKLSADQAKIVKADNIEIAEEKLKVLRVKKDEQAEIFDSIRAELDNLETEAIASAELDDELRELITARQKNTATVSGPIRWPIENPRITSSFGNRFHPIYKTNKLHTGIDVCPPRGVSCQGGTLLAAGPGTVIFAGWKNGYGNTIIIDHGGKLTTLYAHMSKFTVSQGQKVIGQERIGLIGSSGNVTGAHLHFEVRVNGVPKNPQSYLS